MPGENVTVADGATKTAACASCRALGIGTVFDVTTTGFKLLAANDVSANRNYSSGGSFHILAIGEEDVSYV